MKQTSSFQRWKRRYFKLRGSKLSYSKNPDVSKKGNFSSIFLQFFMYV